MSLFIASSIMRTTLDIDDPILREVKAIHEREGRSIGAIVSELLAEALARRRPSRARPSFRWTSREMKPLVDLADKEAVYAALVAEQSLAIPSTLTCSSPRRTDRATVISAPADLSSRAPPARKYSA